MARLAPSPTAHPASAAPVTPDVVWTPGRRTTAYDLFSSILQGAVSALALLALSPLFAVIAVLIKLSSPGPVFYRGERVGQDLRRFRIYKFRTMIDGAEAQIGSRLIGDADKSRLCTRVGRFLKRTKLDELPQLLNVVKGDMRLVGPRPLRPVFLDRFLAEIPGYHRRFLVRPGITGIAQLRGGYYTSPRNKLRYDWIYVRRRSLLLDARLVVLTFVKILNRGLSTGLFVLFLFLFASFIPVELYPVVGIPGLGATVSLLTVLLAATALWVFVKGPAQFSLYRCPINLPILLFVVLNLASSMLADDPSLALQGSAYYVVTGFLTAFVIVNTLADATFIRWAARVVALTSVAISLLGLFEIFLVNQALDSAPAGPGAPELVRASSILGNPVALAVYLVLGLPLLLAELSSASTQRGRDFWLVCSTISFVGIFLTQTRIGLLALMVTGIVFLYRRRAAAVTFVGVCLLGILLLVSVGLPRFSIDGVVAELTEKAEQYAPLIQRSSVQWLIGTGASGTATTLGDSGQHSNPSPPRSRPLAGNMHLTLALEHGLAGWLIIMWAIVATIRAVKQAHDRTKDERTKTFLWAIASALVGYVVSMTSMNTFHSLPIQVFFWSLIGIGLGLGVNGERRHNLIWHFGEAGD